MYLIPYNCLSVSEQQDLMLEAMPAIEHGQLFAWEIEHGTYTRMEDGIIYPCDSEITH